MGMATMLQSREPRRGSSLIVIFASGLALADAPLGLRLGQGRLSEPFHLSSSFDTPSRLWGRKTLSQAQLLSCTSPEVLTLYLAVPQVSPLTAFAAIT